MDLSKVFSDIKKSFTISRTVDFDDYDLHLVLEPLTTTEELKVLASCGDLEGAEYIEGLKKSSLAFSIKRINDVDLSPDEFEYTDDNGSKKKVSKFIMLSEQIGQWPASVRDVLFEAYNNLQLELEEKVKKSAKFERFRTEEDIEEEEKSVVRKKFKRITESNSTEGMTDVEKMNRQVEEEVDDAQAHLNSTEVESVANEQK